MTNGATGEDFGSFADNKPVKLAVMLGLIETGDEGCLMDYTRAQKEIIEDTASLPLSMAERREIFAFVANNERMVQHLLAAPDSKLLMEQSRMYVMDLVGDMETFEAVSKDGKITKTWHDPLCDQTVTLIEPIGR
ncbi:MAG: hypothetical protein QMC36_00565 [Patescibacteria group bacterium]